MVSKEMKLIINQLKAVKNLQENFSVKLFRKGLDQLSSLTRIPKDVKHEIVDAGGISAEWISTQEVNDQKVVLYLHGGGYIAGSIKTHRDLAGRIARASKARVLLIDYRLAPENPFPAALEDSFKAYKWIIFSDKISPKNIIIAGDSAGGGLTLALLIKLRNEDIQLPAGAVCLSPWTDLACTGESFKTKADLDPFLTPKLIKITRDYYLEKKDYMNPLASPLYANLKGLPPLLIQVGTFEILFEDSKRLAERAKSMGVDVELDIWEDVIHVFQAFAAFLPEGQQAIEKIGHFIQKII